MVRGPLPGLVTRETALLGRRDDVLELLRQVTHVVCVQLRDSALEVVVLDALRREVAPSARIDLIDDLVDLRLLPFRLGKRIYR